MQKSALIIIFLCLGLSACAVTPPPLVSRFPIENYNQTISHWIKPTDPDYNKPLLTSALQAQHMDIFIKHYVGSSSPWSPTKMSKVLLHIKAMQKNQIAQRTKEIQQNIGYGENFHPYTLSWIEKIAETIDLAQFESAQLGYQSKNRGIAVANSMGRLLPTDDVYFYSYKKAGQGYPFDNLQQSALWAGTPLYIVTQTKDKAWSWVITPDFTAWVKTNDIARVSNHFIKTWQTASYQKQFAAITKTQTSLISDQDGHFLLSAYVGSVFPAKENKTTLTLMVPVANIHREAVIKYATVSSNHASMMPLVATPREFARIIATLIGRPYGWGNMYFYNDCSAELKSLFTPFGIRLPRQSSDQLDVGEKINLSDRSPTERIDYLQKNGRKFLTLIYIGKHTMLYVGKGSAVMTYQNVWGLSPTPSTRRAVIGQAVLFPLLLSYPEDKHLASQAAKKYFKISHLDHPTSENH